MLHATETATATATATIYATHHQRGKCSDLSIEFPKLISHFIIASDLNSIEMFALCVNPKNSNY